MPIDYKKYPKNWKTEIRPAILERANHCCEFCGVKNYAIGNRTLQGDWMDETEIDGLNSDCGFSLFGEYKMPIKIVLTVAHLNHNTQDNRHENLKALCQKCHLNYDVEHHRQSRKSTYHKKRGMQSLFELREKQEI